MVLRKDRYVSARSVDIHPISDLPTRSLSFHVCALQESMSWLVNIDKDHDVFLHWINPPHLKSLPGIDHVHILYRSKEELTSKV